MNGLVVEDARVKCRDCPFSEIVEGADERRPADVVIEHGRETGHQLDTKFLTRDRR